MKNVIIIGAGNRGAGYADIMKEMKDDFRVVAVAEPVEGKRNYIRDLFDVPEDMCHTSWEELLSRPKFADLAVIATMDRDHFAPAMAAIEKGYDLLLEKPMGATPEECCIIERAAAEKGVLVLVCHVLRFSPFFRALKNLIDSGLVGDVVHIQHAEDVGNVHQSHSFVRGNWHNSEESTPMIVQKTCHDMDIMQWLFGKRCTRVSSFGGLYYFKEENAPEGSAERCIDCPCADTCYYSAEKIYLEDYREKSFARSAAGTSVRPTDEQLIETIRNTDYGRCVFRMDNNVVDHQTVNLEFDGGVTASFCMCAFNKGERRIRIMGTKGELSGKAQDSTLSFYDFATCKTREIQLSDAIRGDGIDSGHGGGDRGIIKALRDRLNGETGNIAICTIEDTCRNHLIAYAAEESRIKGTVINMEEYENRLGGLK